MATSSALFAVRRNFALAALIGLGACGSPDPQASSTNAAADAVSTAAPSAPAVASAPLLLETIDPAELASANRQGERGCAFYATRNDDPLFVGKGPIGQDIEANGLVKIDRQVTKLAMNGAGGYDQMAAGATFAAGDLAAQIAIIDPAPVRETPAVADGSPTRHARLTSTAGPVPSQWTACMNAGPEQPVTHRPETRAGAVIDRELS